MSRSWKVALIGTAALVGLYALSDPPSENAAEPSAFDQAYEAKWQAIEACHAAVLLETAYPSKANFHAAVDALSDDNVHFSVVGMVDIMNDFGAMLPHRYVCVVQNGQVMSGSIS